MAMDPKKLERLLKIKDAINKSCKGAGANFLGNQERIELKRFHTGCVGLDEAMGGGIPRGRLVEVYGDSSTGKTTWCYHVIAEFQKKYPDDPVGWIDSEFSFDQTYAEKIGVIGDEILIQQPESGEEALNVIKHMILSGVKLIVVDSVAALVPRAEKEKDIGDKTMGEAARLLSSGLKQLNQEASRNDCTLLFTNQIREKIGVMYGDKNTTPGGKALKFYASIRVELKNMGMEKENDVPVCMKVKAKCTKNKTYPPFRETIYTLTFGVGIDSFADLFNDAVTSNIIQKSGSWFSISINGQMQKIGQGKLNALNYLRENKEVFEEVKKLLSEFKASGKVKSVKKPKGPILTPQDDEENNPSNEDEVSLNEDDNVEVTEV